MVKRRLSEMVFLWKVLKVLEYGCLLDVSTAVAQQKKKERMIQVGKFLFSGYEK